MCNLTVLQVIPNRRQCTYQTKKTTWLLQGNFKKPSLTHNEKMVLLISASIVISAVIGCGLRTIIMFKKDKCDTNKGGNILYNNTISCISILWSTRQTTPSAGFKQGLLYLVIPKTGWWKMWNTADDLCMSCM